MYIALLPSDRISPLNVLFAFCQLEERRVLSDRVTFLKAKSKYFLLQIIKNKFSKNLYFPNVCLFKK